MYIPKGELCKEALKMSLLTEFKGTDLNLNLLRHGDLAYTFSRSIVIANAWAMGHDPDVYRDPFIFNPNRYLPTSEGGNGEPVPVGHFGFGRR